FAADRGASQIAGRYEPLSAPFLRMLRQIADRAEAAGVPVTVCGELAGRPTAAMALIGLGYRSLSMSPASVGPVKAMIRALDAGRLAGALLPWLHEPTGSVDFPARLAEHAASESVPL